MWVQRSIVSSLGATLPRQFLFARSFLLTSRILQASLTLSNTSCLSSIVHKSAFIHFALSTLNHDSLSVLLSHPHQLPTSPIHTSSTSGKSWCTIANAATSSPPC